MSGANAMPPRRAPAELYALISANAALWAGEAEVFSAYFASPRRTPTTDERWIARQCYKEIVDGVVGRLSSLSHPAAFESAAVRAAAALADDGVRAELTHYIVFRTALQVCREAAGTVGQAAATDRVGADWPENAKLQTLRAQHRRDHGAIGRRAEAFTEGGYCTLYRAGMALKGGGALDDAIAAACGRVFDDEWDHMLHGIAGMAETPVPPEEWALLEALTLAQGRCRIRMRNAQFGYPLSVGRIRDLEAGSATPLVFDYARAGLLAP
jgi:hypothetical protein